MEDEIEEDGEELKERHSHRSVLSEESGVAAGSSFTSFISSASFASKIFPGLDPIPPDLQLQLLRP